MKRTNKLLALVLALAMIMSLGITAFAAEEGTLTDGKITIVYPVVGQTYSIYQILYLESYNKDTGAYAYKANSRWEQWIRTEPAVAEYLDIDEQGYVTWVNADTSDGSEATIAFAKLALAYAKDHNFPADRSADATSSTVEFVDLKLGYYLVDTTLGTLCSLGTTNSEALVLEKNEAPTNVKTVKEDSTDDYGAANDADIGQVVEFKSTITLPRGSENVVFHDTMSAGLTLDKTEGEIKVYTNEAMTNELSSANYSVNKTPGDCTFEVSFDQAYLNGLTETATVYVKYSATVNANAVIGGEGNKNTSNLSYGDGYKTAYTPDSDTTTYVWEFDVLKYGNGDKNNVLADAKFVLLNNDKSKVAKFVDGKFNAWADVPAPVDGVITWPTDSVLTTDAEGKINIEGLDADTYYLRETEAPAGYNKLTDDTQVVIAPTASNEGKTLTLAPVTVEVENQSGTELPSTGGMGTTLFYILGGVLVVCAGVLLVAKKRMSAEA